MSVDPKDALRGLCKSDPLIVIQASIGVLCDEIDACTAEADRCGSPAARRASERVRWMADEIVRLRAELAQAVGGGS